MYMYEVVYICAICVYMFTQIMNAFMYCIYCIKYICIFYMYISYIYMCICKIFWLMHLYINGYIVYTFMHEYIIRVRGRDCTVCTFTNRLMIFPSFSWFSVTSCLYSSVPPKPFLLLFALSVSPPSLPPPLKGLECLVSEWARQSVSSVDRAATWWGRLHGRGGGVLVLPVLLAATSRLLIVCVAVPET